jgi:membrane-associated protein
MDQFLEWTLHADEYIGELIKNYGGWTYLILCLIIFVETGLVVVAFFPGDGLLFSAGLFAAAGALDLTLLIVLLTLATILGNTSNFFIGRFFGDQFFQSDKTVWGRQVEKAHAYHEKYGPWAVSLSRFVPFMRTLVPFTAGLTGMSFRLFTPYNVIGGLAWILAYLLAGFFFGEIPWVKEHYGLIFSVLLLFIFAVLAFSILQSLWRRWRRKR